MVLTSVTFAPVQGLQCRLENVYYYNSLPPPSVSPDFYAVGPPRRTRRRKKPGENSTKLHCRKISAPSFVSTLRHLGTSHRAEESENPAADISDNVTTVEDWVDCSSPQSCPLAPASPVVWEKAYSIITYRKKLRQQRYEMKQLKADHQCQLEEISSQLLQFEASLRAKEKLIEKNMYAKDQVILKQQRLIKKLLRSKRDSSNDLLENINPLACNTANASHSQGSNDAEEVNDSDSAIILEDSTGLVEVSLTVPNLGSTSCNNDESSPNSSQVPVVLVNPQVAAASGNCHNEISTKASRKSKEESSRQRISNRQKLFLLKRHHSGYLKRPEILETVYSVEEDSEQQQQQQQQQLAEKAKNHVTSTGEDGPSSSSRRESSASSISLATIFRKRLDSDLTTTTGSDCSTDDESFTRIVLSETESCSLQSCSRSTSLCHCWQCAVSASAPASRRSSYGSNVINVTSNTTTQTDRTYYRVMTNRHKSVTKPKDVKFKRINKAKSRSLEELRGQLKCPTRSSSTNDEDIDDLEEDDEECSDTTTTSRLGLLRKIIKQKSLSLEHESTD